MAIGALLGAGLFVSGLVCAIVILVSKEKIRVIRKVFIRDVLFYVLSLFLLASASVHGKLDGYYMTAFFLLYIIFIGVVLIQDKIGKSNIHASQDA